jgi:DHA2 family methylenomycin A resistance protein-like MFS transporter
MSKEITRRKSRHSSRAKMQQTLAFTAICFGFFMVVVDAGIVNVAIPAIGQTLGNSLNNLEWVINSYTLVLASLLLTAGAIGDRIGPKRLYLIGLALFTIASLWCSFSTTLILLVIARVLQGLGGAMLIPASLSLIAYAYPDPAARSRAIGTWATISTAGFTGSITLGGLLIDSLGWPSIFWLNVPIGLIAFVLTWRFVPRTPGTPRRSLDWAGQVLAVIALFALTFALIEGQVQGWTSPLILSAFLTFAVAALLFGLVEWRARYPMLPLELFTVPAFSTATVIGLLFNFCLYGQLFIFSLFLQNIEGHSATATGLAFLPFTVVNVFMPSLSGWLTARIGPRTPTAIGLVLSGMGAFTLTFVNLQVNYPIAALGLVLLGLGGGLTMPAMTTTVLSSAPASQSGIASAILNSMRQVGGVLGVAVLGVFVSGASFIQGMHLALIVVALIFLLGCSLTLIYVPKGKLHHR